MSRRMSIAKHQEKAKKGGQSGGGVRFAADLVFLDNIRENDLEAASQMLRRASLKMDINDTKHGGLTPLHQACLDGNLAAVKLLVEHGADINKQDEDTWTPLHAACQEGHLEVVKWLVKQGADTKICTDDGERPMDLVDSTDFALISFLLSHKLESSSSPQQSDSDCDDKDTDECT